MTQPRSPQVFISYRHEVESPEHADRVLGLANRLRDEGIDAVLDQYEVSPPAGWPTWCEHEIQRADFVLMVCTEAYHRCIRGDEQPGAAHGVLWEARIIRQMLYDTGSKTTKLIPVLFSNGSPDHIPIAVKGATRYVVDTKQGFEDLYRQLTDQLKTRKPELGTLRKLPERVRQWREPPLAKGQVWAELHNVPELPPHFLPRPDSLDGLKRKLLGSNGGAVAVTGVATRIGVQGMGGIGKSVLTAAVVRDNEVRSAFPAGIFWISLGQMPDVLTRQADLYWLLTREKGGFADTQQGRIALQEALRRRSCLVVLDDVWRLADAEAFNVVDADARLLLTTRDAAIVKGIGARDHEVDRLDRSASRRLLAQTASIAEESLPAEADVIAEECGDLALALALAGGMIEGRADMWSLILEALRTADWEQINRDFAGYPYPGVFTAIEASVNALGADRERYLDLAIFPEDVPFPEAALKTLWADLKPLQVRTLVTRFRDRSLARLDADNRLTLHDLQRDFVRKRASDLPARHVRLVEAYRPQCQNSWASGPDDGYFFRFLLHHLAAAGRRNELKALLADYAWIEAKLKATNVQSVISDYDLVANEPDLSLVQRALRLSIPALSRDWTHLPSQLIGRLRGIDEPRIRALLKKASAGPGSAWLCPQTASLTAPGPLLQTFEGPTDAVTALAVADGHALYYCSDSTLRLWDLQTGDSRLLEGHTGGAVAAVVLPDGRALSGSQEGTLRLWDLQTGDSRLLTGHTKGVTAVTVLPDGRRALSGSLDKTLRLWDLQTGDSRALEGHTGGIRAVAVLPDGRRALSGSEDCTLRLWDLQTGDSRALEGHTGGIRAVAVLPDGRRALSGGYHDKILRLWDLQTGGSRLLTGHTKGVTAVTVLPDGRRALSGSEDCTLRLWDLQTGDSRALEGHTGAVSAVAVLPDGRRALSGGYHDKILRLWDLEAGDSRTLEGHTDGITALAVLPGGRRALSSSWDWTLRLWDLEAGDSRALEGHTNGVTAVAVLPDGRALSGSQEGTLRLWDLQTGDSRLLTGHTKGVTAVTVLPDGRRALSGSEDCTLRLWDLQTGDSRALEGHTDGIRAVAVLPDGRRALSASYDSTLRLWDLQTGGSRLLTGHTKGVTAVTVLPDGRRALSGSLDKTLRLWDLQTGDSRALEGHTGGITALAVLPDERRALSASSDNTLRLWDLQTGDSRALEGHTGGITALAVLPDGRRALSGGYHDKILRLWDLASGESCVLTGHTAWVSAVAVLPDGRRALSSSSWDWTIILWDLETGTAVTSFVGDAAMETVTASEEWIIAGSKNGAVHLLKLASGCRCTGPRPRRGAL